MNMTSTLLPHLDLLNQKHQVGWRNAKHDKIETIIRGIEYVGSPEDIDSVIQNLAFKRPRPGLRVMVGCDIHIIHFCKHQQPNPTTYNFNVREEVFDDDGITVLAILVGKLTFKRTVFHRHGKMVVRLWGVATLSLNPTRLIAHENSPARALLFKQPSKWKLDTPPLYIETPILEGKEVPLQEDCTNVILGYGKLRYTQANAWPIHLIRHLGSVDFGLKEALEDACSGTGVEFGYHPEVKLRYLEIYWEFWSTSAMTDISYLLSQFEKATNYSERYPVKYRDYNSEGCRFYLRSGIQLSIYVRRQHP